MSNLIINQRDTNVSSLEPFSEHIVDYFSNTTDDENEKELENQKELEIQNRIISNSVEKVIINPDTLSQYNSSNYENNKNAQLPSDLVNQLKELSQSLLAEDLDNSIVNNIEESEVVDCDIKSDNRLYSGINVNVGKQEDNLKSLLNESKEFLNPVFLSKKKGDNNDSLLKKVVNGLFLDNKKPKPKAKAKSRSRSSSKSKSKSRSNGVLDLSLPEINTKPVNGLSTLYSFSPNRTNVNNQNNILNGLKSPLTPSVSSPDIENAVISSPIVKQNNQSSLNSK